MGRPQIEWSQKYELGIDAIDFQHRYFAGLINRLSDELDRIEEHVYFASLLSELTAYARFHFISEENLMYRAGYPDLTEHRSCHRELIDRLSARINRLELDHSENSGEAVITFLTDWFSHHTLMEDRKFSDWAGANGITFDAD